ncbi:MAG: hypothetical protein APF84_04920 [Gracilibacter sp. BRH_c7a]|nr:MAG: hypothetical protein APF84_04920 [Gracilibacter sp. BRH_c7a]
MSSRLAIILISLISSGVFLGIIFTNDYSPLGLILGFLTGLINIQWLSRDTKKAIDQEKFIALRIYFKSLFSRLGVITLIVATVGRFRPEWLLFLALGIAVGIIIPLILSIRQQIMHGRG